jgi:hypothetical protein
MRLVSMLSACLVVAACSGDGSKNDGDHSSGDDMSMDNDARGPGEDGAEGDAGPGVDQVSSCYSVHTLGDDGEAATDCTEFHGKNAAARVQYCTDVEGTHRKSANAACPLDGAIARCDYASRHASTVFYLDLEVALDAGERVCEEQGGVFTVY